MSDASNHWEKTKGLLFKTLAAWAFFAFIIHWFGNALARNIQNYLKMLIF